MILMPKIKSINGALIRSDIRLPEKIDTAIEKIAEKETVAKASVLRRIVCEYIEGLTSDATPITTRCVDPANTTGVRQ